MEVNDELAVLRRAIPAAIDAIRVGGRVVVESYHSLEDRLVKQAFTAVTRSAAPPDLPVVPEELQPAFRLVTRGAEQADADEIASNPRAASVRLRAVERIKPTQGSRSMSSPALQLRERLPRLAEDAVDRARLTVVPRRRVRAARMPFVTLVSLVLLGGVVGLLCFNTQMQQASFAATVPRGPGRQPRRPRADPPRRAPGPAQPPAPRDPGPGGRHGGAAERVHAPAGRGHHRERLHRGHAAQHPAPAGPPAEEAARPRPGPVRGRSSRHPATGTGTGTAGTGTGRSTEQHTAGDTARR